MMVQNTKKRVLVTYVEAGFGHITCTCSPPISTAGGSSPIRIRLRGG